MENWCCEGIWTRILQKKKKKQRQIHTAEQRILDGFDTSTEFEVIRGGQMRLLVNRQKRTPGSVLITKYCQEIKLSYLLFYCSKTP